MGFDVQESKQDVTKNISLGGSGGKIYQVYKCSPIDKIIQLNLNNSNIFGTMSICSRQA